MIQLYWACLVSGVIFALITLIFDDTIDEFLAGILDVTSLPLLEPMVLRSGVTIFGGAGIMLNRYTAFVQWQVFWFSVLIATCLSIVIFFIYVKPMKNAENTIAFSAQDLVGRFGEVIVPIPVTGYGEVLVKIGSGHTNQIATCQETEGIATGVQIRVDQVIDGVLLVSMVR